MASPLADLDELILKCRDEKARKYIKEAVSCYKAGAFRSAIVSTWIAVAFDIIDKLKELALTGDKEAEKQLEEFEKARKGGDIARALKFEKEILEIAKDKLELISHIEYLDLGRLQEDRNRCAHPSMTADGDIFNPPAELARVHIRTAVECLLQYPPAQGKYALEKLVSEVSSEYFPDTEDKAITALKNSPLFKPRESLVRNFVVVLLKRLIGTIDDYKERRKDICALKATESMHKEICEKAISDKISDLLRALPDDKLHRVIPIVRAYPDFWNYTDDDMRQKIVNFVEQLPSEIVDDLDVLLNFIPLKDAAIKRVNKSTVKELKEFPFFDLHPIIADRIIDLYLASTSFDQANDRAKLITGYASDYSPDQVERIIRGAGANDQIEYSFEVGNVINALRQRKKLDFDKFENLLEESGLSKFKLTPEPEEV